MKFFFSHEKKQKYIYSQEFPRNHKSFFRMNASHITYCVCGNSGDTYLSWCVRKVLSCKHYDIIPVAEPVSQENLDRINATSLCIVGGGGLFLPDTNENAISGWQWAISDKQLDSITCPLIVYSIGYNYFYGHKNSEIFIHSVNKLVEKASFVGLRNSGSVNAIRNIVFDEKLKDKVCFQPCITTVAQKLLKTKHRALSKTVVLNMAFDRSEMRFGQSKSLICKKVASAMKLIADKGYAIYYAVHCVGDREFLPYLDLEKVSYELCDISNSLPNEILQFYNSKEIVLGMRGHSQMIPFGLGCRIISLGTHPKIKWFLEDINSMDLYVDLNQDIEQLDSIIFNKFLYVNEEKKLQIDKRLENERDRLWNITMANRDRIKEIVSTRSN